MITKKKLKQLAFFILIIVAISTRLLNLGNHPKGLQSDEASFLLNAIAIMETGKDEDNRQLPLFLNSYIDPKPAVYSYFQIPFIKLLGSTTTASRIPAAIFGIASLAVTFWMLKEMLPKKLAVITTVLLVLSPWHIVVSRATQEVIVAFLFSMLSIGLFSRLTKNENKSNQLLQLSGLLLSSLIAFYFYHSTKVFLPLLFGTWTLLAIGNQFATDNFKKNSRAIIATASLAILVLGITILQPSSLDRFSAVGLFSNDGPQGVINEQITTATPYTSGFLLRIYYNKLIFYFFNSLEIYWEHFSPTFLFLQGGQPDRYVVPYHGLFYLIELPLMLIGLFVAVSRHKKNSWLLPLLLWIIVAPVPAALTYQEVPSIIRSFPLVIPLLVFIAYGLLTLWDIRKNIFAKLTLAILALGYIWGIPYFFHQYTVQQTYYRPWHRNTAEQIVAQRVIELQEKYTNIELATIKDLYAYVVLAKPDLIPELQTQSDIRWKGNLKLENITFNDKKCSLPITPQSENTLYVFGALCDFEPGFTPIETITYNDGVPAYSLVTYKSPLPDISIKDEAN